MTARWRIDVGDNRELLPLLPADHFDAVVCDPPYELGFMGRRWDSSGIAYDVAMWRAVLRVMKPGAHLLAFGGTRTYHRMACAIEYAGFEIRDSLMWLFAQGMPKSHNISKAIDREAGAVRTETEWRDRYHDGGSRRAMGSAHHDHNVQVAATGNFNHVSLPATDAAKYWDGWGSALSPCYEPIVMARKPFKGTLAGNVQEWGTGGSISMRVGWLSRRRMQRRWRGATPPAADGYGHDRRARIATTSTQTRNAIHSTPLPADGPQTSAWTSTPLPCSTPKAATVPACRAADSTATATRGHVRRHRLRAHRAG